jgi:hypothetical protein
MNGFFNHDTEISRNSLARSYQLNQIFEALATAFDLLPTEAQLKNGTIQYGTCTGGPNNYVLTLPYTPTEYLVGTKVRFIVPAANVGQATLDIIGPDELGLGAVAIKRVDGSDLLDGDLPTGSIAELTYQGTYFQLNNARGDVAAATASALASASSATDSANSASASATSETNAAGYASNASDSADDAAASAAAALEILNQPYVVITAVNYQALKNEIVLVDTDAAEVTITAPTSPVDLMRFRVADLTGNASRYPISVNLGSETFKIDVSSRGVDFYRYNNEWRANYA